MSVPEAKAPEVEAPEASASAAPRTARRANRFRQIVEILARHGFGFMVGKAGWEGRPIARILKSESADAHVVGTPERLRLMIEDLGPTFIKLGQILSTRGDLLPVAYREELAKLQDSAPPVAGERIRTIFAEEFGRSVDEVFATFDMRPIAAASIGQAHAATLPDGSEVIVKLRRPHIIEQVEEDLRVLVDLSYLAARHWEMARYYDIVAIVAEFAQTLRAELDYLHEGRNLERIADNFAGDTNVHIPKIYWDLTTARVLTLERIRGVKITNVAGLEAQGCDRGVIARRATRILLTMILRDGFFHADPHAGNVFVERDGRIGLIDFGMVGEVDRGNQDGLMKLMLGITQQDASRLADTMLDLSAAHVAVDRNALRRDLQRLLGRYSNRPMGDVRFGSFISDMIDILRVHHLRLPPDLALLLKTLVMGEGLGAEIDPTFNLMEVYLPLTEEVIRQRFSLSGWTKQFLLSGIDALESSLEIPQRLRHILGDIERGGFEVNIQPSSFDPYFTRLERLVNHVLIALLAVSCTISTAFIVAAYHPTGLVTFAEALFLGALLLSGVFGLYILYLLISARRRKL